MSFGDPNNPYGPPQGQQPGYPPQPPQGQQPGYGYPAAPQAPAGYGYPSAPPLGQPGYGVPMEMPGLMKTARVLLFILAGFQLLFGLIAGVAIGALQDASNGVGTGDSTDGLAGLGFLIVGLLLALGALSIFLGVKFKNGGSGIRITTIIYSALMILGGITNIANGANGSATFGGLISLAMAGIILASMVTSSASTWFNRPRY
ncbi:hypothetical protein [Streptomyces naphthomycinicus]|uniref:hypothetical protein n=1 Tax=Streptomyces naphthomycinicus TaxID=2872625 RepID=UPI001CECB869|nr:hypothetical protein [Streptomyces sp. TML10]